MLVHRVRSRRVPAAALALSEAVESSARADVSRRVSISLEVMKTTVECFFGWPEADQVIALLIFHHLFQTKII